MLAPPPPPLQRLRTHPSTAVGPDSHLLILEAWAAGIPVFTHPWEWAQLHPDAVFLMDEGDIPTQYGGWCCVWGGEGGWHLPQGFATPGNTCPTLFLLRLSMRVCRAVLKNPNFFLLGASLQDSPQGSPTTNRHQPPTAKRHLPRTAANRRQPLPTANRRPPTANRRQLPIMVQYFFCGFMSCPCLDHEAESVPVNVRFCWRYEPSFLFT